MLRFENHILTVSHVGSLYQDKCPQYERSTCGIVRDRFIIILKYHASHSAAISI